MKNNIKENLPCHVSIHLRHFLYYLTIVMTLSGDVLQNGISNTGPEPIRVHLLKANESTDYQLHVPASYRLSIPDTKDFNLRSVLSLTGDVLQNSDSSTTPQPIRADEPKANQSKGHQLHIIAFLHLYKGPNTWIEGAEFHNAGKLS
jgi:hypothetical protein